MHFISLLASVLFTTSVVAHHDDHHHSHSHMKTKCDKIAELNGFISFASNTTLLNSKFNATKVSEIQAQASLKAQELSNLQSNQTLVADCATYEAHEATKHQCLKQFELQHLITFAGNTSAVAAKTNNSAVLASAIAAKASAASSKLATLTSNSTLQTACAVVSQKHQCEHMVKMQKRIQHASNQTWLSIHKANDPTKIAHYQAKASAAQLQVAAFQANQTFMAACSALSVNGSQGTTIAHAKTAGAGAVRFGGEVVFATVAAVAFALGMCVL